MKCRLIDGYGWDPRSWKGFEVLRDIRDIHPLSAYLRRASFGDSDAAKELRHRLDSLRRGDLAASWRSVS